MNRYLTCLCLCSAVLAAACGTVDAGNKARPTTSVVILQPAEGDTVGSDLRVVLGAQGVKVVPADGRRTVGEGHHHLFIDTDVTPADSAIPLGVPRVIHMGTGVSEWTLSGLPSGPRRIIAVLAYGDHVPMQSVASDTIHVVVR